MGLRGEALMIEYPRFEWDKQRGTRVDVAPGPAVEKNIWRESFGEGECGDRKFYEARGPIGGGTEFPL